MISFLTFQALIAFFIVAVDHSASSSGAPGTSNSRPNTQGSLELDVSFTQRRRSLLSERPKTSTSAILRSYSSSSFESPDEDEQSDWDDAEESDQKTQSTVMRDK